MKIDRNKRMRLGLRAEFAVSLAIG